MHNRTLIGRARQRPHLQQREFKKRRPHNKVAIFVDEAPVAIPLVPAKQLHAVCHQVLVIHLHIRQP